MNEISLGKATVYKDSLDPSLLYPIPRKIKRDELGIDESRLPFQGVDIWNAYEISWLNSKGKPMVAMATFFVPFDSPNIVESKSFKLYLNSLNQTQFKDHDELINQMVVDLNKACGKAIKVTLQSVDSTEMRAFSKLSGKLIDNLDIEVDCYEYQPELLQNCTGGDRVEETLMSHLLKSNCLVTGQPDWGSVQIHYRGGRLKQDSLLKYLISFRKHQEFHEQCVERIFMDLMHYGNFEALSVYARYTRRGGLDINPFRTSFKEPNLQHPENCILIRQ